MSIKLLAIRPMKGCGDKFIKNLKPNCIYRFYNEYEYLDFDKKKISDKVSEKEVSFIKKNQEIPDNFYAKNINISAIVGANGSGKSGLFDLIYSFNYNLSKKFNIENFDEVNIDYCKINVELYFEETVKKQTEIITYFYKIIHNYDEQKFEFFQAENSFPFNFKTKDYNSSDWQKIYYLGINYSLYGLNSLVNGDWVKKIFHKNDGYQSPISINPFRTDGCIDVNNEFNLAQSRLILSEYILKDNELLKGIRLNNIDYSINLKKNQYIKDDLTRKDTLIINEIIEFNSSVFPQNNSLNELLNIIFKNVDVRQIKTLHRYISDYVGENLEIKKLDYDEITTSDLKMFLDEHPDKTIELYNVLNRKKIDVNKIENSLFREYFVKYLKHKKINDLQYLCFLYIYKKLKKITINYSQYKRFNFLFNEQHNLSDQLWSEINKSRKEIIDDLFDKKNSISINRIKKISIKEYELIRNEILFNSFFYFESLGFNINDIINDIDLNQVFNNQLELFSLLKQEELSEDGFFEIINKVFLDYIKLNQDKIFKKFIDDIYKDESHITFKFRQILSYFKYNIFENIGKISLINKEELIYKIEIKEEYYKGKSLAEVPLTFFNPKINIKKNNSVYSFNRLSSGEQQMIHSLLNIKYHLFNLQSIKEDNILTYRNINILFDDTIL